MLVARVREMKVKRKRKTYRYGVIRPLPPELIGKEVVILTKEEFEKSKGGSELRGDYVAIPFDIFVMLVESKLELVERKLKEWI